MLKEGDFVVLEGPKPTVPPLEMLSAEVQTLFFRCFDQGRSDPADRPSAREWRQVLEGLLGALTQCEVYPARHRHYRGAVCPWCVLLQRGLDYFDAGTVPARPPQSPVRTPDRAPLAGEELPRQTPEGSVHMPHGQSQDLAKRAASSSPDVNKWSLAIHLSLLCAYYVPLVGWIVPVVLWQVRKSYSPIIDTHGRIVANWIITQVIYWSISVVLCSAGTGILPLLALGGIGVMALFTTGFIFPIVGAVKAAHGKTWRYPLSIRFFRVQI